jgi:anti-sigma regulatory factor (Ser/Thr protein kinase)
MRDQVKRVKLWDGGEVEWALCAGTPLKPPSPLCLDANRSDTVQFFDLLQQGFLRAASNGFGFVHRPSRPRAMPRISNYYDFGQLSYISTAASVMLAAEYQRVSALVGAVPPTVNLHEWNPGVYATLTQLGFFEIVGIENDVRPIVSDEGHRRTMRIICSSNADALPVIDDALQDLGRFLSLSDSQADPLLVQFLTALAEAIANVVDHAYGSGAQISHQHIQSLWVTATADKQANSLTVVVYDQGATIPSTYPRIERVSKVKRFLSLGLRKEQRHRFDDDGTYIRAAMRYGGSRTDQKHRGLGLPQMFDAIKRVGAGSLSVYSRGGWCKRDHNGRFTSGALPYAIGGTLVEWSVKLSDGDASHAH